MILPITQAYTYRASGNNIQTNKKINQTHSINFKGLPKIKKEPSLGKEILKLVGRLALFGVTSIGILLGILLKGHIQKDVGPMPTESNIKWPKNTTVYASSSQNNSTYSNVFERAFLMNLKKTNSVDEAFNKTKKYHFPYPEDKEKSWYEATAIKTPRDKNFFVKSDTTKHRFIVGMFNNEVTLNDSVIEDTRAFVKIIKDEYKLDDSQTFIAGENSTTEKIDSAFWNDNLKAITDKIEEQVQKGKIKRENIELLIYYGGHGGVLKSGSEVEGSNIGKFKNVTEPQIKSIFKKNPILNSVNTGFFIKSCKAGSWIAENTTTNKDIKSLSKVI